MASPLDSVTKISPFKGLLGKPASNDAVTAQLLSGLVAGSAPVPTLEELKLKQYVTPEEYQYLGDLRLEDLSPTELRQILTNPEFGKAGTDALARLEEISQTGMSAIDRAALAEIQAQQAAEQKGMRESILSQARQRGMGGSGMELAQQLQAQQEGSNLASRQGLDVAAQSQANRQNAILQRAGLGQSLQQQEFEQKARTASAQDAINQFNVQNRNLATGRNLDLRQQLAGQNTEQRNRINQSNVDLVNQATQYNVTQKPVQQYGMQSGQAQAIAQGISGAGQQSAANQAATYGANAQLLGSVIGGGATMAGGALAGGAWKPSDERLKENIEKAEPDIETFLKELVPYKFNYKPSTGLEQGKQVGIMAQDLEKSPAGSLLVQEDSQGKKVDLENAIPTILASLGYLNKKIEELK